MNRWKKEELKRKQKAREGLSEAEIRKLDIQDAIDEAIRELAHKLHTEMFPEEYDHMFDDYVDAQRRSQGENPMSADYIERINRKRQELGVSPLSESGMSQSGDTSAMCRQIVKEQVEQLRVRIDEILHYKWDPLRLSDSNWNRWEYESYVPEALMLTLTSDSSKPLADYLKRMRTEYMGESPDPEQDEHIAELIYAIAHDIGYMPGREIIEVD